MMQTLASRQTFTVAKTTRAVGTMPCRENSETLRIPFDC